MRRQRNLRAGADLPERLDPLYREVLLPAGVPAILLAFAHIHPELWFLSLFALVPFLKRLSHAHGKQAALLGMVLASAYVFATCLAEALHAPHLFFGKLIALNIAFVVFAAAISRVNRSFYGNPLLIAVLWFPIGYLLVQYAGLRDVIFFSHASSSVVSGFCSLFGVLVWSCAIVFGNLLILAFAKCINRRLFPVKRYRFENTDRKCYSLPSEPLLRDRPKKFITPNRRAPPATISVSTANI